MDLSGIGRSEGDSKDFTLETMTVDITLCLNYIKQNYNGLIHFFGGTGLGDVLAEYYVSGSSDIKSFAQFGVAVYKDISLFPNSGLLKFLFPLIKGMSKLFPNMKLTFTVQSTMVKMQIFILGSFDSLYHHTYLQGINLSHRFKSVGTYTHYHINLNSSSP